MNTELGITKALDFAGGVRPLARLVGLHPSYIQDMKRAGNVPANQCLKIHKITGVALHELNPKIYPEV